MHMIKQGASGLSGLWVFWRVYQAEMPSSSAGKGLTDAKYVFAAFKAQASVPPSVRLQLIAESASQGAPSPFSLPSSISLFPFLFSVLPSLPVASLSTLPYFLFFLPLLSLILISLQRGIWLFSSLMWPTHKGQPGNEGRSLQPGPCPPSQAPSPEPH